MTRRLTIQLLLILLWSGSAAAAERVEVRDGSVASAQISAHEANRLVIRNGRIHKVWGAEGKASLKADADTGQVYLLPDEGWTRQPFSLFVQDENGGVYTLSLTPANIPAETVMLVRADKTASVDTRKAQAWETSQPYEETLVALIKGMASGQTPDGYARTRLHHEFHLWQETNLVLTDRYTGSRLDGEVYAITNVTKKPLRLSEHEFYRPGVLAVSLDKHDLAAGATTTIYLVVRGDAQ